MLLLPCLFLLFIAAAVARPSYSPFVPNARRVVVDGTRVYGLGHPTITSFRATRQNANPFGKDLMDALDRFGNDPDAIWTALCDLDSDGDNISNKVELCDPNCNQNGRNPTCPPGSILTHPGIFNEVEGTDDPVPEDEEEDPEEEEGEDNLGGGLLEEAEFLPLALLVSLVGLVMLSVLFMKFNAQAKEERLPVAATAIEEET